MAEEKKLGLFALIALVIGSMIGGGAFNLASDMASGAGAGAILIGWIITGVGMIALAFSFQNLTTKRPDLDGGIFTYAREGFGHFMGFNSGWGYWFAALLGNVAYGTLLFSAVGYFIKPKLMSTAPHLPTICSMIAAIEGLGSSAKLLLQFR